MKTSTKAIVYTTLTSLPILAYFSISVSISETVPPSSISSKPNLNLSLPPVESIDIIRIQTMSQNLRLGNQNAYKEYKELCKQATQPPRIGMNFDQARNSTWCFPYNRNTTTNASGEFVQEIYLTPGYNGESDLRYSPRRYLYFTNGILTSIQE